MCIRLFCLCVSLLLFSPAAQAKLIPYYRMDSLAFLTDAIVLCEEQSVAAQSIQHEGWRETVTRVRCRVTQTFKGDLAMGSEFEVEYNSLYSRVLPGDEGGTFLDAKGKVLRVVEPKTLPPGRALLSCGERQRARCPGRWSAPSSSRASRFTSSGSSSATPAAWC